MDQQQIEQVLLASLEDNKLDRDEKHALAELTQSLQNQPDSISFIRNKAFALLLANGNFDEEQFRAIKWLENVVKTLDKNSQQPSIVADACFSPGNDCLNRIVSLCQQARRSIDICVFTISCNEITDAILQAHQRGVAVRIISDNDKRNDKGSDVYRLSDSGIPVVVDQTEHHMHHKFAVFDQKVLLNGSFNWTRSASKFNQENIATTDNPKLVNAFGHEFERLWHKLG